MARKIVLNFGHNPDKKRDFRQEKMTLRSDKIQSIGCQVNANICLSPETFEAVQHHGA
jgi:hypothetical protein